jgi:septal ring factor EnvC (AmiA/AmiB activator)
LKEQNNNLLIEIQTLRAENNELKCIIEEQKIRIDNLEKELTETKKELTETKKELTETKKELTETKKELMDVKMKIEVKEENEYLHKMILAIQDINRIYELENNIKGGKKLLKLRKYRNKECHYIDENDEPYIQNRKIQYLLYILSNIKESIKVRFENICDNGIIKRIINYIEPFILENIDEFRFNNEEIGDDEITYFWEF